MFEKKPQIPQEIKQEMFLKIRPIIAKQLETDEQGIRLDSRIVEDLSADSLDAIQIIMALEEAFNIEILDPEIDKIITIEDIVVALAGKIKP